MKRCQKMTEGKRARIQRAFLVLLGMVLIFAGPTYVVLLIDMVGVPFPFTIITGGILFLIGLFIVFRLIKTGEIK